MTSFSARMVRGRHWWWIVASATAGIVFLWEAALPLRSDSKDLPRGGNRSVAAAIPMPPHSFADIAVRAMPAVVNIATTQTPGSPPLPDPFGEEDPLDEFLRRFFRERLPPGERQSLGSGFIISTDGYIVTNNHVIGNAKQITVRLAQPRREEYEANVIGVDELTDIALIKIAARGPLPTIPWGSSANLRIGDWLIAIGNPFGLDQTVTAGIVSGKGRVIGAGPYDDFIQTDASINPGNSGGPLLNLRGEVVGVNSAILSRAGGNIGIGFATPIDLVKSVVAQLKGSGRVTRGWLGVSVQVVTADIAYFFGLDGPRGALITEVVNEAPADAAGIKSGDIIISFNGIPIKDAQELPRIVARMAVGNRVNVDIIRDGREQTFMVAIGALPSRPPPKPEREDRRAERWGITVTDISPEIVRRFRLEAGREGVAVIAIERDSSAARAGIQVGDVIEEVNRQPIRSLEDFEIAAAAASDSDRILIFSRRGDTSLFRVLRQRD